MSQSKDDLQVGFGGAYESSDGQAADDNGLFMIVRNPKNGTEETFSCAWAPFNDTSQELDWLPLATSQVTFPNIVIHDLNELESIEFLLSTLHSIPSTKALLLINTDNSFDIDKKFYPKSERPPVPTLVLARDVGIAVRDLADTNPRSIEVKVELKINVGHILSENDEIENASLPNTARANTEILVGGKTEGNAKEQPEDPDDLEEFGHTYKGLILKPPRISPQTIILHEMENIESMINSLEQCQASWNGVVVINTINTLDVDNMDFLLKKHSPVPIFVVKNTDGIAIKRMVDDHSIVEVDIGVHESPQEQPLKRGKLKCHLFSEEPDSTYECLMVTVAVSEPGDLMEESVQDHFSNESKSDDKCLLVQFEKKQYQVSYQWISEYTKEVVEWREICFVAKESPHILCVHTDCPMVEMQPSTEAIMLIVKDKSTIDKSTVEKKICCYQRTPILVIDEPGEEIWKILAKQKFIECKIFLNNQLQCGDVDAHLKASKSWSLWSTSSRHPAVSSASAKIIQLLFGATNAAIPTCDTNLFKIIMEHLYMFETHCGGSEDIKDIYKTIKDNWMHTFSRDFPFYLALSYRVNHLCHTSYKWQEFHRNCILMLQKVNDFEIINVTNAFLSKADFLIVINAEQHFSARTMISKSLHYVFERQNLIVTKSMGLVMKIATLYVRFSSAFQPTLKQADAVWRDAVKKLQDCDLGQLNTSELHGCLLLGKEFLMEVDRCKSMHIAKVLSSLTRIQKFENMQQSLSALKEWLIDGDTNYFEQVFRAILISYDNFIDEHPHNYKDKLTSTGNRTDVVFQGLQLLTECYEIVSSESRAPYKELWIQWLNMLMKFIKFGKDEDLYEIIFQFFNPQHSIVKVFETYLTKHITKKVLDNVNEITTEQFSLIYLRCGQVIPSKVLNKCINVLPFGSKMKICDDTWRQLLSRISREYPTAREQLVLVEFFKRAGIIYGQTSRKDVYLRDILSLNIPKLFYIDDEQIEEDNDVLNKFFQVLVMHGNMQPTFLLEELTIMDIMPKEHQQFHESILVRVSKVVNDDLKKADFSPPIKSRHTLEAIISRLCKQGSKWPALTLSNAIHFHLLCGYLKEIGKPSIETLDNYYQILEILCKPCHWYLKQHNDKSLSSVEIISLYCETMRSPSRPMGPAKEFRVNYFKHMKEICNTMLQWKTKMIDQKVTYYEIIIYSQKIRTLDIIAKAMGVSELVFIDAHTVKHLYEEQFEELNKLLLYTEHGGKWCSFFSVLEHYGVKRPENLIEEHFMFPDSSNHCECLKYSPKLPEGSSFKPPVESIIMRMKKDLELVCLAQIVHDLKCIISKLSPNMNLIVYFHLNSSKLFDEFLQQKMLVVSDEDEEDPDHQIIQLGSSLKEAILFLKQLMEGAITFGEIDKFTAVDINEINVDEEFKVFSTCPIGQCISSQDGSDAMKSMLKLLKSVYFISKLIDVCDQFKLNACLEDPGLHDIKSILKSLESKESKMQLTPTVAHEKWGKVCELLYLKPNFDFSVLFVFETVSDSVDFFHFLDEMGFTDKEGEILFRQQHELVTAKLEQDPFTDSILNHLFGAFFFVLPFMDHAQNLQSLMKELCEREVNNGQQQLETVKSNMHLIRYWFSRVQDGLVENVSSDLENISKSGEYVFSIATRPEEMCQLFLRFKQHGSIEGIKEQVFEWGQEQCFDFEQKLGFLQESHQLIKVNHFRKVMKAAKKLFGIVVKLRDFGYPAHCRFLPNNTLSCTLEDTNTTESMVRTLVDKCETWIKDITNVRKHFKWLSFFSIPKILHLHSTIKNHQLTRRMILEFYYIFKRDLITWQKVENASKAALKEYVKQSPSKDDITSSSIYVIGSFLKELFLSDNSLEEHLAQRYDRNIKCDMDIIVAKGCSQKQLIHLLVSIYNGIPEYFDILRCHSATTVQDLRAFMDRVILIPRLYVIVEVNLLSFELQEVLFNIISESKNHTTTSHLLFVETDSSMMQLIPWFKSVHCEENGITKSKEEVQRIIHRFHPSLMEQVHIVYGAAGDGKTHKILKDLDKFSEDHWLTVSVNESFTVSSALQRMMMLNRDGKRCAIFFNFTFFKYASEHKKLSTDISWFFIDLLLLGYVEDISTGISFCRIDDEELEIYIEVPSQSTKFESDEDLNIFLRCFPIFELIGTHLPVDSSINYSDDKVQLVCKYLKAYKEKRINKLCLGKTSEVRFSTDKDINTKECSSLLKQFVPDHLLRRKVTQRMFVHYMWRRCQFLENFPGFIYNTGYGEYLEGKTTDTRYLGSTLMETMLNEVSNFCNTKLKGDWGERPHQQLIYDFSGGGGTIGLISHLSDRIQPEMRDKFTRLGINFPSPSELHDREVLDAYLARALGIRVKNRIQDIDDQQYVLTVDYALKMLDIHERYHCGIPVIIEGETGVGKTSLVDMLSILWNRPWLDMWNYSKDCIIEEITKHVTVVHGSMESSEQNKIFEALHSISSRNVSIEHFEILSDLCTETGLRLFETLQPQFKRLQGDPLFTMLDCNTEKFDELFDNAHQSSEDTAKLLTEIFTVKMKSVLYKLNVHAALQPLDIKRFFEPGIKLAESFHQMYTKRRPDQCNDLQAPRVIVYLDEINTASCLGLLKELITDKTLNGDKIPSNIFIIAACNPHRGHSLATLNQRSAHCDREIISWLTGTYYVRQIHPTLEYLKWDYGSLNSIQEDEYIGAKLWMIDHGMTDEQVNFFSDIISSSQIKMREYAAENLTTSLQYHGTPTDTPVNEIKKLAKKCAKSSVSQRDIQRVLTFYLWFKKGLEKECRKCSDKGDIHERAMTLSLGLVYYMRLSLKYRQMYESFLSEHDVQFRKIYDAELEWLINSVKLPEGIAKTNALKENLFAVIACTATRTPLIIVGDPGSSKTLSFNVAVSAVQGKESKNIVFRDTDVYQLLHPHFYQCSRRTTSFEIDKVFKRAIERQRSLAKIPLPEYSVVFMDEAGLPEQQMESLKVLHYYLDVHEVSFVAISNHILDAAKTNRAVSLFRPKVPDCDLQVLAKECIHSKKRSITSFDSTRIEQLCRGFQNVLSQFQAFYGLRDFMHFVKHLKSLDDHSIMQSLERNFHGSRNFPEVCKIFFRELQINSDQLMHRNTLEIIYSSSEESKEPKELKEYKEHCRSYTGVHIESRYKLIIDPSDDVSLVRLLFSYNVLPMKKTRICICSDFPSDHQSEVTTIQKLIHSVAAGHTVLLFQTDKIHESFYDLFNQRFRSIRDPKDEKKTQYFANIAIGAHSKPCRVDPKFECLIVIDEAEVEKCPPPFLNRFEKYYLDHKSLLQLQLEHLPPCLSILLQRAKIQVQSFVKIFESTKCGVYGLCEDTIESLFLTILPTRGHEYTAVFELDDYYANKIADPHVVLLIIIQDVLRKSGFRLPKCDLPEIQDAAVYIFQIITHSEFQRILNDLKIGNITSIVDEAFNCLYNGPSPNQTGQSFEMYTDACVMIAVILQWLVMCLCKKLMQLVTPEALVIHNQELPRHYCQIYMKFQEHFDLKKLVHMQLKNMDNNEWDQTVCASKLICFTRESALIHGCPQEYDPNSHPKNGSHNLIPVINEYIWDKDKVMLVKLSVVHSQDVLQELLNRFFQSDLEVFVMIINSQQIHRRMTNHLRIMIEDEERLSGDHRKIFILLFQISPQDYYTSVYPTLFLQGWDHHYLDSIAPVKWTKGGPQVHVVNMELWFELTCLQGYKHESWNDTVNQLLKEAVPVVTSKLDIPTSDIFSSKVNAFTKSLFIERLLIGDKKKVGNVLVQKFCHLWNPQQIAEYIDSAANAGCSTKSTLNMIETLETTFRFLFFDFLVYMLSYIGAGLSLDLIFNCNVKGCTEKLFYNIIDSFPCPALFLLPTYCSGRRTNLKYSNKKPLFPFFNEVSVAMKRLVSGCSVFITDKNVQVENDATTSITMNPASSTLDTLSTKITNILLKAILENDNGGNTISTPASLQLLSLQAIDHSLVVVVQALQSKDGMHLREDYCNDFFSIDFPFLTNLLSKLFSGHGIEENVKYLVTLHIKANIDPAQMANFKIILRKLSEIHELEKTVGSVPLMESIVCSHSFTIEDGTAAFGGFTEFIVETLADTLKTTASTQNPQSMAIWQNCYHKIVSDLSMEDICTPKMEFKLNIMHATSLIIRVSNDIQAGLRLYNDLQSAIEVQKRKDTRLKEIVECALLILDNSSSIMHYFKELLSFFFSTSLFYKSKNFSTLLFYINNIGSFMGSINLTDCVSVLKYYFFKTLTQGHVQSKPGSLKLFVPERRQLVGEQIIEGCNITEIDPYIPIFYQMPSKIIVVPRKSAKNGLMEKPLCHMYFIVVLEILLERNHTLMQLNSLLTKHSAALTQEKTSTSEKTLLQIEKQALAQALIHQLACQCNFRKPLLKQKLHSKRLTADLNKHLCDEYTGGSAVLVSGHGLVSVHHLQSYLSDPLQMLQEVKHGVCSLVEAVKCIQPLATEIEISPSASCVPFLGVDTDHHPVGKYYEQIYKALQHIHTSEGSKASVDFLIELTKKGVEEFDLSTCCDYLIIQREELFRMLLWLATYHGFTKVKKDSRYLHDVFGNEIRNIVDPDFAKLLQCFVYRQLMTEECEKVASRDDSCDPLYNLFTYKRIADISDESEAKNECIRDALICLVAAIVACPSNTNHLWYNLFKPEQLEKTFLPGFMLPGAVHPGNYYDAGICLNNDGLPKKPAYFEYLSGEALSINSLHLVLWASIGAFSVCLLHKSNATAAIKGKIISEHVNLRHYCFETFTALWDCIGRSLKLSPDKLQLYLRRCMLRIIYVSTGSSRAHQLLERGVFHFQDSGSQHDTLDSRPMALEKYERVWQQKIFIPSFNEIENEYQKMCGKGMTLLLQELRQLKTIYPHYPSSTEFTHDLLLKVGNNLSKSDGDLFVITQFALSYDRLCLIGTLLPDLIKFYQWIHTELVLHRVTWNYAATQTLDHIITKICGKDTEIAKLFERVYENYNKYLDIIEGNIYTSNGRIDGRVQAITSKTSLLSVLSTTMTEEEEQYDSIFLVIADMVDFHNDFLKKAYHTARGLPAEHLRHPFPDEDEFMSNKVNLKEVSASDYIVPYEAQSRSHYVHLIRTRWKQPNLVVISGTEATCEFDFNQLQLDIINEYILKKPLIADPRINMRMKFVFLKKGPPQLCIPSLEHISIKDTPWVELHELKKRELECEYHSAGYQKLVKVITALWTVSGHIKKYSCTKCVEEIEDNTIPEFLLREYDHKGHNVTDAPDDYVMKEVGFIFDEEWSLTRNQMDLIKQLQVKYTFSMLNLFIDWVKNGVYNFHYLPLNMKVRLNKQIVDNIDNLPKKYEGSEQKLLQDLISLEETLLQHEQHLRENIIRNFKGKLKEYIKSLLKLGRIEPIELIPEGVKCENYVYLRIALGSVMSRLQDKKSKNTCKWTDKIDDLWDEKYFKHLLDAATPYAELEPGFVYDPCEQKYGFEYWIHDESSISTMSPDEIFSENKYPSQEATVPMHAENIIKVKQKEPKEMTREEVGEFLKSILLEEYVELFVKNGIDGEILSGFDVEDLQELGVSKKFQCKMILRKFKSLIAEQSVKQIYF